MSGSTYEGDFKSDLRSGNGTLTWDDGRQYRGQFDNGMFHGHAVMTWPDGRKYRGQYADDKKHGEGTFAWQDGRRYQGQWVVGKRHGIGVYTNAKGFTRTGMWQMDRPIRWEALDSPASTPQSNLPPLSPRLEPVPNVVEKEIIAPATPPPEAADPEPLHDASAPGSVALLKAGDAGAEKPGSVAEPLG